MELFAVGSHTLVKLYSTVVIEGVGLSARGKFVVDTMSQL
jgi:hypothetical protein